MPEFGIKVRMVAQDEEWAKARSRKAAENKVISAMEKRYPDFDIEIEEITDEEGELLVWRGHEQ
jgi:hypothetical protein